MKMPQRKQRKRKKKEMDRRSRKDIYIYKIK